MKIFPIFIVFIIIFFLQGCVPASVIGIAAIGTKAVIDPRTIGTQIDDNTLQLRINHALSKDKELKNSAHINAVVYQGKVLLIGQTLNSKLLYRAEKIATNTTGIKKVFNEIRIEKQINLVNASLDAWITAKIRSKLLANQKIKFYNIKITTENSEVFLLGLVTKKEEKIVTNIVKHVNGVKNVKTIFTYLS